MAIDINYRPGYYNNTVGNVACEWWCVTCQVYHSAPWCPWGEVRLGDEGSGYGDFSDNITFEICPHCGQLIKREM